MTTTGASTIYNDLFRSFGLRENPFHVSPDPRFHFSGPAYETAIAELMFGIEGHRGLLVLTGEAGTGKTTLMRKFLRWLGDRNYSSSYIFHTHLDPAELLEFILRDFGVPVESTKKTDLLASLHRWLHARQAEGDSPVIIIDEAQALSLRTLSELTTLLNLEDSRGKLVQIVLAGQPELEEKLRRPELRALRQRIMVRCRLPLLTLEETSDYILARMQGAGATDASAFPRETVQTLYSYARGIPRIVNLLCEHALIGAYADRHKVVTPTNIRKVAAEFDFPGEPFASLQFDAPMNLRTVEPEPSRQSLFEDIFSIPTVPPVETTPKAPYEARMDAPQEVARAASAFEFSIPAVAPIETTPKAPYQARMDAPREVANMVSAFEALAPTVPSPEPYTLPELRIPAIRPTDPSVEQSLEVSPSFTAEAPETEPISAEPQIPVPYSHFVAEPEAQEESSGGWRRHRSESGFVRYWREVVSSFTRDMRRTFRPIAWWVNSISSKSGYRKAAAAQRVPQSVGRWLREPMNPTRPRTAQTGATAARANKS